MDNRSNRAFPRRMAIALTAVFLAILAGGAAFYKFQEQRQLRQVEANLTAIARLKADQIAAWLDERLNDGADLMDRSFLIERIARWMAGSKCSARMRSKAGSESGASPSISRALVVASIVGGPG